MQTALYHRHCALDAKMVSFADWEMPIQYKGVLTEHQAVRTAVGVFDVSHMGRISVRGVEAESLLDYLSTNQITHKESGSATYTVWCHATGGCVDDVIIYRESATDFFVIVNASNREKDLAHLLKYAQGRQVEIQDHYQEDGILALQGPHAYPLLVSLYPDVAHLKPMHFLKHDHLYISRTGYTGAGGYEFYGPQPHILALWDLLLEKGPPYGLEPAGLGARDTLRLEMGFALYGHELSDTIYPNESVSAWTIHWDKPDFLGKSALERVQSSPVRRHSYAIRLLDKGIARQDYPVYSEGRLIGKVTSGSFSPGLNCGIALILVDRSLKIGDSVAIEIRQTQCQAEVVQLPFVRKQK